MYLHENYCSLREHILVRQNDPRRHYFGSGWN